MPKAPAKPGKALQPRRPAGLGHRHNSPSGPDPVRQSTSTSSGTSALTAATPGTGFAGLDNVDGYIPPDTEGAVGDQYYVQWINASFAVFDKSTGAMVYGPAAGNVIWSGFTGGGGVCASQNDGDPIVRYDTLANRWVMSQLTYSGSGTGPGYECVAVSATADPLGQYYRYAFLISNTDFGDYPKLAVWPDGYYLTVNLFNGNTYDGPAVFALDRAAMLSGGAATSVEEQLSTSYFSLMPAELDGATLPPNSGAASPLSSTPEYLVSVDTSTTSDHSLLVWTFDVDTRWGTTGNQSTMSSSPEVLTTATYYPDYCGSGFNVSTTCVNQPGTGTTIGQGNNRQTIPQLDSLGDRIMYRVAYRNFGSYQSLVFDDTVNALGGTGNQAGVRWYEVRNPGKPVVAAGSNGQSICPSGGTTDMCIYQQSTYAPDGSQRWMGSAAMDRAGDIAIGYSLSSSTIYPSIAYTTHTAGSTPNQMDVPETIMKAGAGVQVGISRWGDYSSLEPDPSNDCTFWYTDEYYTSANTNTESWSTWIGSFSLPTCTTPQISLSTTSLGFGSVVQGRQATQTVQVSNPGSSTLHISALSLSGPQAAEFSTSPSTPFTVAPGAAATVDLTFSSPSSQVGAVSATLELTSDATPAPESVSLTASSTPVPGSLTGTVQSTSSTPLAGICVGAFQTSGIGAGSTTTNSSGAFTLSEPPGQYKLRFSPCSGSSGSATQWWINPTATANDFSSAGTLTVTSGTPTTADITLANAGSVAGTVSGPAQACVTAYTSGDKSWAGSATTATGGGYVIGGLAAGQYYLLYTDCGAGAYAQEWYPATGTTAPSPGVTGSGTVSVSWSTQTAGANITLPLAGTVTGTVTSSTTGLPLSGICVSSFAAGGGYIGRTTTGAAGTYTLGGLPPGTGTVALRYQDCTGSGTWATGWDGTSSTPVVDLSSAAPISIASGQTTTAQTVALQPAGFISGTVTEASSGATIANVCVLAYSSAGSIVALTLTDSTGEYTLGGLPAAALDVKFEPCGTATAYTPIWYNQATSQSSATAVTVTAGTTVSPPVDAQLS